MTTTDAVRAIKAVQAAEQSSNGPAQAKALRECVRVYETIGAKAMQQACREAGYDVMDACADGGSLA